jgi:flagellar biosynthesis/type III secretory pathway M-ring protein FliF/YscJ
VLRSEKLKKDSTDSSGGKTADADGKNSSKNTTQDREFVTEIGERRTGKLMPEIRRMSVAVIYDKSLANNPDFVKDDLVNAVKAIVGWDQKRDVDAAFSTLVGEFVPPTAEEVVASGPGLADTLLRWGPTVGQILGVLVVVMFLRGLFRRAGVRSAVAGGDAGLGGAVAAIEEKLTPEESQKRLRSEIEKTIAADPAALAKLLETWLMEQKA